MARVAGRSPAEPAERHAREPEAERGLDPGRREPEPEVLRESDPEGERQQRAEARRAPRRRASAAAARGSRSAAPGGSPPAGASRRRPRRRRSRTLRAGGRRGASVPSAGAPYDTDVDAPERHLRLLTETIAAVNSTLDLEEVLDLVATKVADALEADACFVYLYDERSDELVLRATHGTSVEEMTRRPRMRPGEGITGSAAAERAPVMIPVAGAPRPALQALPEPARGRVRVDPRRADPRPRRAARGRAQRAHPRAARVRRGRDRAADRDRRPGGAVDRARAALRAGAAPRRRARGARADLGGGLGVALPRGVARGDREDDDGRRAGDGRGARARGRAHRVAGGARRRARGAHAAPLEAPPDRRARRRPRLAVLRRRPGAARGDRAPRGGRARARARRHARRARPGDPPPRQEQPPDGRVAAPAPVAGGRASTRARRSSTRSTGSSPSPRCTRC